MVKLGGDDPLRDVYSAYQTANAGWRAAKKLHKVGSQFISGAKRKATEYRKFTKQQIKRNRTKYGTGRKTGGGGRSNRTSGARMFRSVPHYGGQGPGKRLFSRRVGRFGRGSRGALMKDLRTIRNRINPVLSSLEYRDSGVVNCDPGRQNAWHIDGYDKGIFNGFINKSTNISIIGDKNVTDLSRDKWDRRIQIDALKLKVNLFLMNGGNHDLVVHRYLFSCRLPTFKSPNAYWVEEAQGTLSDLGDPYSRQSYGATPVSKDFAFLNKFWRCFHKKVIKLDVSSQFKDVWSQPARTYKAIDFRTNFDTNAIVSNTSINNETTYYPGCVTAVYVVKSKDLVVSAAAGNDIVTPGAGRIYWSKQFDYAYRVPPISLERQKTKTDFPTGGQYELNFNQEMDQSQTYNVIG